MSDDPGCIPPTTAPDEGRLETEILCFDSSIASIAEMQTDIVASIDALANGNNR
jgi:hypothetical protein